MSYNKCGINYFHKLFLITSNSINQNVVCGEFVGRFCCYAGSKKAVKIAIMNFSYQAVVHKFLLPGLDSHIESELHFEALGRIVWFRVA